MQNRGKLLYLFIFFILLISITKKLTQTFSENFTVQEEYKYKILPNDFHVMYNDTEEQDLKNQSAKILLNQKKSGVVVDLNALNISKVVATFEIPERHIVKNITIHGSIGNGMKNNDNIDNISVKIYEKFIDKESHNLVGIGKLNESIKVDIDDKKNNYLLISVDILDSIIFGGSVIAIR